MADHDDWTADDDAQLRAALTSLRADVESTPMPDVRFVKARGMARRRQRLVTWTAAAAAAAVVVGTVGYSQFGRDTTQPTPPATQRTGTTSTIPSPTTTDPTTDTIMLPGVLPPGAEWQRTLGLAGEPTVQDQPAYEGNLCQTPESGKRRETERVVADANKADDTFLGVQTRYTYSTAEDAVAGADGLAQGIANCFAPVNPRPVDTLDLLPNVSARTWSYSKDGDTGWLVVVHAQKDVAYLEVGAGTAAGAAATPADVKRLAVAASARLDKYGSAAPSTAPSSTTTGTSSGPKAINEKMPVTGPDPLPSSDLFVAGSQWSSSALTGGAKTSAGPGALEGSTAVASCESNDQQAGIGGSVGVVSVRTAEGAATYIGRQRVQLDESTSPAMQKTYVQARLSEAKALYAKGCGFPNGTVKSHRGPSEGTYRLDTVFTDGSPTLSEWVGVTTQATPGAVTTIVVTKASSPAQGFAELDRLLALARQK